METGAGVEIFSTLQPSGWQMGLLNLYLMGTGIKRPGHEVDPDLHLSNSAHTVFVCFVFIPEQTATSALHNIMIASYDRDEKWLLRGTNWTFNLLAPEFGI
jgi:hypothetical protein